MGALIVTETMVNEWVNIVRRARLGRTVKLIALTLVTYADPDGTRVHPGVARLAVDCEVTYNVVKASLARLRDVGLIRLVQQAARRGDSDLYHLVVREDLLEHVTVLSPAEVTLEAEKIRAARRGKYRAQAGPPQDPLPDPQPTGWAADSDLRPTARAVDNPPAAHGDGRSTAETAEPAAHGVHADTRPAAHGNETCGPRRDPPPTTTHHKSYPPNQVVQDPQLATAHTRDPKADIPSKSKCADHGLAGGNRDDGSPRCPLCRALAPGGAADIAARRTPANVVQFRPREPELRSCRGCFAPTDHPDRLCPKCQPAQEAPSA